MKIIFSLNELSNDLKPKLKIIIEPYPSEAQKILDKKICWISCFNDWTFDIKFKSDRFDVWTFVEYKQKNKDKHICKEIRPISRPPPPVISLVHDH